MRNGYPATREDEEGNRFTYSSGRRESAPDVALFNVSGSNSDEGFADLLRMRRTLWMSCGDAGPRNRSAAREAGMGYMTGTEPQPVLSLGCGRSWVSA